MQNHDGDIHDHDQYTMVHLHVRLPNIETDHSTTTVWRAPQKIPPKINVWFYEHPTSIKPKIQTNEMKTAAMLISLMRTMQQPTKTYQCLCSHKKGFTILMVSYFVRSCLEKKNRAPSMDSSHLAVHRCTPTWYYSS